MEFEPADECQPTRERVARSILEQGPSTAAALAARLDLTPAAVRRHLDHLVAEAAVEARDPRPAGTDGATRGRGRPAKVFAITESGRDRFDQQYDDLALQALRFLAETGGDEAVRAFADRRMSFIEAGFADVLTADPTLTPGRGAGAGLHRRGLRRLGARAAPGRAAERRRPALPAALPRLARGPRVPPAVRGRDRGDQPGARPPRATAGHHRPRRRGVHHLHPDAPDSRPRTDKREKVTT